MKLLIIEDEAGLQKSIKSYLEQEGYLCETADTYEEASEKIFDYEYDCVLVDITLPGGSGLDLVDELKEKHSEAGIIIISAKDSLDDRITGLESGSDDYITKPFHLSELNARIKALIRRKYFRGEQEILVGELKILPLQKKVFIQGTEVELTSKEYDILSYFLANTNRVLTKEAIAEHVWGDHYDAVDSLDFIYVHINNLRKKMMKAGGKDPIKTAYGMGYKFAAL